MKPFFILSISIFLLGSNQNACAQLHKTIDSLQAIEQDCLDSGRDMANCSCKFDNEMDSILNVVYKNIRTNLDSSQKIALKKEEFLWLKKRQINDEDNRISAEKDFAHSSINMIACHEDAGFVIDRIFAIIKKWDFKKIYSN